MILVEILIIVAAVTLLWLCWQLYRAKQFTKFKHYLKEEIQPQVVELIITDLEDCRSSTFPNNTCHQAATINYWTQYHVRILQYALEKDILNKGILVKQKRWRFCQHLLAIEQRFLNPYLN